MNTGGLTVYAEDENGHAVSGATVVVYDSDYNVVGERTTDSSGQVSWSSLEGGTYNLELYNDGEFWTAGSATVETGSTTTTTLRRAEPYHRQTELTDAGDGDGTYTVGDPVNISPNVYNDKSYARNVRVTISVDTDNDGTAEDSVTRGPISISSDSDAWYGYDFVPESSGTHNIRVQVETEVGGSYALTDDTGWHQSFDVQSNTGTLEVTAEEADGSDVSGAGVMLYDDNYNQIGERTTDSSGQVSWSGLDSGTYNVELYDDGEYWAAGSATVETGATTTTTLRREEPYHRQTDLTDAGDGDGTYTVGDPVNISPNVYNDKSFSRDVRVIISVDTDNDGTAEDSVTRGPLSISSNSDAWYGYDFVPDSTGTHSVRVRVETYVSGSYTLTDDTGWHQSFEVDSNAGGLSVTAEDADGATVSGAGVVLYDDNYNRIGERTTDSSGQVSWSGLDSGTYNVELYDDGEYWAAGSATVETGTTTTTTLQRAEPYHRQTDLTDAGDGDGTYEVGEPVNISPNVYNEKSFSRDARVIISIDTDNDGTAEDSVTRGPLSISSNSDAWYGYDFVPESTGTHNVRVQVETYVSGSYTLTDDTGWHQSFDVQSSTGGLTVTAEDADGATVAGADVVLLDDSYNGVGEQTTDSNGQVSWSDLDDGTYYVELYNNGEFWAAGEVAVETGPASVTLRRTEPYHRQTDLTDAGNGDGTYEVGEPITISPNVYNDHSGARDARVRILVDTDGDGTAEDSVTRGPLSISSDSDTWYGYDFVPESTGTHHVRVQVETYLSGSYVLTDDTGWHQSFSVDSETEQPPESWIESPNQEITIQQGESLEFAIGADDPDSDLGGTDWYVDGSLQETTSGFEGSTGTDSWIQTFDQSGTYTVKADVFDEQGQYNAEAGSWTVTVEDNQPPKSNVESPNRELTIQEGNEVELTVDAEDSDGNLEGTNWYIDGSLQDTTYGIEGSTGTDSWTRTFEEPGTYTVEADVFDDQELYNAEAASWTVRVEEEQVGAAITDISADGTYQTGATVPIDVTVENTGNTEHTFYVDGVARGPDDEFYYAGETSVTLEPEETTTATFALEITEDMPTGPYDPGSNVFESPDGETYDSEIQGDLFTVEKPTAAPESERESPSEEITIDEGEAQSFAVSATHPNGQLQGVEWSINGETRDVTTGLDGSTATDEWEHTFDESGTYTVEADVFTADETYNKQSVVWTVTVRSTSQEVFWIDQPPEQTEMGEEFTVSAGGTMVEFGELCLREDDGVLDNELGCQRVGVGQFAVDFSVETTDLSTDAGESTDLYVEVEEDGFGGDTDSTPKASTAIEDLEMDVQWTNQPPSTVREQFIVDVAGTIGTDGEVCIREEGEYVDYTIECQPVNGGEFDRAFDLDAADDLTKPPGETTTLYAEVFAGDGTVGRALASSATTERINTELDGESLTVQVLTAGGEPVYGSVRLLQQGSSEMTDEQGKATFQFYGQPEPNERVVVYPHGSSRDTPLTEEETGEIVRPIESGDDELTIRLGDKQKVSGVILGPNGDPIANARLSLDDIYSTSGELIQTTTDSEGRFEFEELVPVTRYRMYVSKEDTFNNAILDVEPNKSEYTVQLAEPGPTPSGEVLRGAVCGRVCWENKNYAEKFSEHYFLGWMGSLMIPVAGEIGEARDFSSAVADQDAVDAGASAIGLALPLITPKIVSKIPSFTVRYPEKLKELARLLLRPNAEKHNSRILRKIYDDSGAYDDLQNSGVDESTIQALGRSNTDLRLVNSLIKNLDNVDDEFIAALGPTRVKKLTRLIRSRMKNVDGDTVRLARSGDKAEDLMDMTDNLAYHLDEGNMDSARAKEIIDSVARLDNQPAPAGAASSESRHIDGLYESDVQDGVVEQMANSKNNLGNFKGAAWEAQLAARLQSQGHQVEQLRAPASKVGGSADKEIDIIAQIDNEKVVIEAKDPSPGNWFEPDEDGVTLFQKLIKNDISKTRSAVNRDDEVVRGYIWIREEPPERVIGARDVSEKVTMTGPWDEATRTVPTLDSIKSHVEPHPVTGPV